MNTDILQMLLVSKRGKRVWRKDTGVSQCSSMDGQFFFGEEYRTFGLHVINTAWIFCIVELLCIIIFAVIVPITIGYFDAFTILLLALLLSILFCTSYAIYTFDFRLIWPMICIKFVDIFAAFICLLVGLVLAVFFKKTLLQIIRMRLKTLDASTEWWHIFGFFLYFFFQLVYSTIAVYAFYNTYNYYRLRAMFKYQQNRQPAHDFLTRDYQVEEKYGPRLSPTTNNSTLTSSKAMPNITIEEEAEQQLHNST